MHFLYSTNLLPSFVFKRLEKEVYWNLLRRGTVMFYKLFSFNFMGNVDFYISFIFIRVIMQNIPFDIFNSLKVNFVWQSVCQYVILSWRNGLNIENRIFKSFNCQSIGGIIGKSYIMFVFCFKLGVFSTYNLRIASFFLIFIRNGVKV